MTNNNYYSETKTIYQILQEEIEELKKQLRLATSQNYCKICGNTLDGYKPKEKGYENT